MPQDGTEHRKLAAIMFTDMVGYSALAQRNETLALELLEEHRTLLRSIFPRFNGTEIKTIGDAFIFEFRSALEAAQCAIEIQTTLATRNADSPADHRILIRIGIHIGDVVHRGDDVYGDGVNIASRIEPLAGAGGICISMDVERQVRNALEARFERLGPTELKNIQVPMEIFRILLPWEKAGATVSIKKGLVARQRTSQSIVLASVALLVMSCVGWWVWHQGAASSSLTKTSGRIMSLAVKPLDDFSGDTNQSYLSDGMTEALCSALGNISALRVPGRASVMRYKGGQKSIPEMGRELNVDAVVEGSLQRAGNRILITVQLIEAATDRHLWSTNYERDLSEFFKIQSDVARAIAAEVQVRLTPEDQARLARTPAVSSAALESYLKARQSWLQFTPQGFQAAIDYCNQAIKSDPNCAPAYAILGSCYIASANSELLWPKVAFPKAKEAELKSLELEETAVGRAHSAAISFFFDWDWPAVERNVQRGLQLSTNESLLYDIHASYLTSMGRFDEAASPSQRAVELEPHSPLTSMGLGRILFRKRSFDQAIVENRKVVAAFPNFLIARVNLGWSLGANGQHEEAVTVFQEALRLHREGWVLGGLGYALARSGQKEAALKILKEMHELRQEAEQTQRFYVSPHHLALVYTALGENAQALDWLEKGFDERTFWLTSLKVEPALDSLRSEPRFKKLLHDMKLDQ